MGLRVVMTGYFIISNIILHADNQNLHYINLSSSVNVLCLLSYLSVVTSFNTSISSGGSQIMTSKHFIGTKL